MNGIQIALGRHTRKYTTAYPGGTRSRSPCALQKPTTVTDSKRLALAKVVEPNQSLVVDDLM